MTNIKYKWISYVLIAASSAGFHGCYLTAPFLGLICIIGFLLGGFLLGAANNRIYKKTQSRLVYVDVLYILFAGCFPMIGIVKWVSITVMLLVCFIYAAVLLGKQPR